MKVLKERDQFLSDYEVYEHLKTLKSSWDPNDPKKRNHGGIELEAITNDIISYLDDSHCANISSPETFKQLMIFLNGLDLVKVEKLQIVNYLPRSMVHLYSLVEECDQRFDQDTCESILNKINELFPRPEEEEEEMEQEMEEDAEEGEEQSEQPQQ